MIEAFSMLFCSAPPPNNLYQFAKDFQTLLAAFVALSAAIITYVSSQRVAQKQRHTTLEVAESQKENMLAEAELQRLKGAVAVLLELSVDMGKLDTRIKSAKGILDDFIAHHSEKEPSPDSKHYAALKQELKKPHTWLDELLLLHFTYDVAEKLAPEEQYDIYLVSTSAKGFIGNCDGFIEGMTEKIPAIHKLQARCASLYSSMNEVLNCIKEAAPAIAAAGGRMKEAHAKLQKDRAPRRRL